MHRSLGRPGRSVCFGGNQLLGSEESRQTAETGPSHKAFTRATDDPCRERPLRQKPTNRETKRAEKPAAARIGCPTKRAEGRVMRAAEGFWKASAATVVVVHWAWKLGNMPRDLRHADCINPEKSAQQNQRVAMSFQRV